MKAITEGLFWEYSALWQHKYESSMTVSKVLYILTGGHLKFETVGFSLSSPQVNPALLICTYCWLYNISVISWQIKFLYDDIMISQYMLCTRGTHIVGCLLWYAVEPIVHSYTYHSIIIIKCIQIVNYLRWYQTLQGDNSFKSVERFDHMMFVCRFQASRWSKPQREKLLCG